MGQANDLIQKQNERHEVAQEIAIEAGVLTRCPYHEVITDSLNGDNDPAHKLAAQRFVEGKLDGLFDSDEQLQREIDSVINDAAPSCYSCDSPHD